MSHEGHIIARCLSWVFAFSGEPRG